MAFLRAVNVAGHARVQMTAVREAFCVRGCENVVSFIQSGNILFDTTSHTHAPALARVKTNLRALLGEEPVLMVRSARDIERVIERAPFTDLAADRRLKLYVVFLAKKPRSVPSGPLTSPKERLDVVGIDDREVYLVSRRKDNGMYGFPNQFVENALGVPATSRNWSTVSKIAARLCGL